MFSPRFRFIHSLFFLFLVCENFEKRFSFKKFIFFFLLKGLTLASQWKSQFDDSEETDDELQGEHLQSPEHLPALARLGVAMLQQQMFGYGSTPTSPVLLQAFSPSHFGGGDQALAMDSAGQNNINNNSNNNNEQSPTAGQTALCIATLPRRSKRQGRLPGKDDLADGQTGAAAGSTPLVKGSTLDGLAVEGADAMQPPPNRDGLPRTWSNPQLSSHIRPGLEPPRLQQAAFDDCVYAVDVMRNVAVKHGGGGPASPPAAEADIRIDPQLHDERKFSLPARSFGCQMTTTTTGADSSQQDSSLQQAPPAAAVAGRLEIRMLDRQQQSQHQPGEAASQSSGPALYLAGAPVIETTAEKSAAGLHPAGEEASVFYDAQATGDEETFRTALPGTCRTFLTANAGGLSAGGLSAGQDTDRLELMPDDDNNESLYLPDKTSWISTSARTSKSPQRRIGTIVPPVSPRLEPPVSADGQPAKDDENQEEEEDEDEENGEEEEEEEKEKEEEEADGDGVDRRPSLDYQVLSEQLDEERRKISVINLNDLSAAFQASSRLRTPRGSPPPSADHQQQRRYSQDDRSHAARLVSGYLSQTEAAVACKEDEEEGPRYDEETSSGRRKRQGVEKYVSDNSQLNLQFERRRSHRPQSGDMTGLTVVRHQSPVRHRSSIASSPDPAAIYRPPPQPPAAAPSSAANSLASYEISRVRSSPSLVPSTSRFPFHYTPHPPTGNPPTLRELDARSAIFFSFFSYSAGIDLIFF